MKANSAWEKSYFYFGRYLDQLAQDAKLRQHGTEAPIVQGKDRLGGKSKVGLVHLQAYLFS